MCYNSNVKCNCNGYSGSNSYFSTRFPCWCNIGKFDCEWYWNYLV